MKKFLNIILFVLAFGFANAQNGTEAKMAYQMAEEKFANKDYTEALAFLKESEAALGSINPPMAYLKVMILNEIVSKEESVNTYNSLNIAIANFEENPKKDALGEDKLMEVYRIKNRIKERMPVFIEEQERLIALKKPYKEMVLRLASEFPKTETTVMELVNSVNSKFPKGKMSWGYTTITDKRVAKWVGKYKKLSDLSMGYITEKYKIDNLSIYNLGEDKVENYSMQYILRKDMRTRDFHEREVKIEEICSMLKISTQQWKDFTSGDKPLIKRLDSGDYIIAFMSDENKADGGYKRFSIIFDGKTEQGDSWVRQIGYNTCDEVVFMTVFENSL